MPIRIRAISFASGSFVALCAGVALYGCASAGPKHRCDLAPRDTAFVSTAPVYEDCAVDRRARLITTTLRPDFQMTGPRGGSGCISAEVRFVVDTLGRPDMSTARLLETNDRAYGEAVMALIPQLRYEPAMLAGHPVRQIVSEKKSLSYMTTVVVVPAGSAPPVGRQSASQPRAPAC